MQEDTKHTVEKPLIAQMPHGERLREFKSYLWDYLTDTALRLNNLGEPFCKMIAHLERMNACGEFDPCIQCGGSKRSTPTSAMVEHTLAFIALHFPSVGFDPSGCSAEKDCLSAGVPSNRETGNGK